jgi:hypothetical protein
LPKFSFKNRRHFPILCNIIRTKQRYTTTPHEDRDLPLPEEEPAGLLERLVPLLVPEDGDPDLLVGHHDGLVDEALAVLLHLGEDLVGGHLAPRDARLARHGQRVDQCLPNDQMCRSDKKYFQPMSMVNARFFPPVLRSHLLYFITFYLQSLLKPDEDYIIISISVVVP